MNIQGSNTNVREMFTITMLLLVHKLYQFRLCWLTRSANAYCSLQCRLVWIKHDLTCALVLPAWVKSLGCIGSEIKFHLVFYSVRPTFANVRARTLIILFYFILLFFNHQLVVDKQTMHKDKKEINLSINYVKLTAAQRTVGMGGMYPPPNNLASVGKFWMQSAKMDTIGKIITRFLKYDTV